MEKRYLNIQEAADYTGFSIRTLYKWARSGMIPCFKIGRLVKFDKLEIDKWFKDYYKGTPNADLLQSN